MNDPVSENLLNYVRTTNNENEIQEMNFNFSNFNCLHIILQLLISTILIEHMYVCLLYSITVCVQERFLKIKIILLWSLNISSTMIVFYFYLIWTFFFLESPYLSVGTLN